MRENFSIFVTLVHKCKGEIFIFKLIIILGRAPKEVKSMVTKISSFIKIDEHASFYFDYILSSTALTTEMEYYDLG